MKSFNSWLKENKLDEVSAELLNRAASVAQNRGDRRGQRLSDKFSQAADNRGYQEFQKDPNKIMIDGVELKVNNVENRSSGGYKIHCTSYNDPNQPTKYTIFIDAPGRGSPNQMHMVTLRNMDSSEDYKISGLNRKSAMIIAKLVNIKPTNLPLE